MAMKKNKLKKTAIIFVVFAVSTALFIYFYVYKNHRDIGQEISLYSISTVKISEEFIENSVLSSQKYTDKTIETYGKVTALDSSNNSVVLDAKMFFTLDSKQFEKLKLNQEIRIKGRFVGFDDLLNELKMDQCIFIK
jgi:hypothetical protein